MTEKWLATATNKHSAAVFNDHATDSYHRPVRVFACHSLLFFHPTCWVTLVAGGKGCG